MPSITDEQTFLRVFGSCHWAVLFILARSGRTYARLRFNVGPGGQVIIPVEVDYRRPFEASDHQAWEAEYQACVVQQASAAGLLGANIAGGVLPEQFVPLAAGDPDWPGELLFWWHGRDEVDWFDPASETAAFEEPP